MEVLLLALGGKTAGAEVRDPLGRPVDAGFALVEDGGTAIVEIAQASGLQPRGRGRARPVARATTGTGELIAAARGRRRAGRPRDHGRQRDDRRRRGGGGGDRGAPAASRGARLVVLCDVRTPLERAAEVFGRRRARTRRRSRKLAERLHITPSGSRGIRAGCR